MFHISLPEVHHIQTETSIVKNKLGQHVSVDYLSSSGLKTISKKQKATKLLERHMSSLKIIQHVSLKTQRQVSLPKFLPGV